MSKPFTTLANIGLAGFLLWSGSLVFLYLWQLMEKVVNPHIKNMNRGEVIQFGLIALTFLILDVLIIRRFIRLSKKRGEGKQKL
jgi:hypothetical protein